MNDTTADETRKKIMRALSEAQIEVAVLKTQLEALTSVVVMYEVKTRKAEQFYSAIVAEMEKELSGPTYSTTKRLQDFLSRLVLVIKRHG